jgi:hypothetical protein
MIFDFMDNIKEKYREKEKAFLEWEEKFIMTEEDVMCIKVFGKNYRIHFESDIGHQEILKIPFRYIGFTLDWIIYYFLAPRLANMFFAKLGLKFGPRYEGFFIFQPIGFLLFGYLFKLDADYESNIFLIYSEIVFMIYVIIVYGFLGAFYIFRDNWMFFVFYMICGKIGMKLAG